MVRKNATGFQQFARAVDIIDEGTFQNIRNRLQKFFIETLKAHFFEILVDGIRVETEHGRERGLQALWTNRKRVSVPILDSQGHYKGQATYAYERDRPLWITAPDKGLLNKNPDRCVDQWSHCEELPPYVDYGEGEGYSKTSIIIPLRYGQKVFGFLNLEFPEYYEFCRNARDELLSLTESLGRIISLHETSIERSMGTQEAFSTLETELSTPFSPLQKPTVFLATSSKADEAVVGIIRKVLGEYHIHFNVSYWKTISTSGNINFQILEAIASSRYGVCYLSEQIPREGNNARFRDNANVLFEAGMLHALTNDPQGKPDAWIPIREAATVTGAVPFDFASERIVEVPRDSNGTLIEEAFVTNLRKQIDLLVPPRY